MRFPLKQIAFAGMLSCLSATALAATYFYVQPKSMEMAKVAPFTVVLDSATLPQAIAGSPYNSGAGYNLAPLATVSGDPALNQALVTFAVTTGTLPTGLALSSAGLLSGTPTVVTAAEGQAIEVSATYKNKSGKNSYVVKVAPGATTCATILASNPAASSGIYNFDIDGTGPTPSQDFYCDMTTTGGGWTLLVKAQAGLTTHSNALAIGTLTSPSQTTVAKLSDATINLMPKTIYRFLSSTGASVVYFDTSDSFSAVRPVLSKASKTLSPLVWEGPFALAGHHGLSTYGSSGFNRSDVIFVYAGSAGDTCRRGMHVPNPPVAWCGAGDAGTIWAR